MAKAKCEEIIIDQYNPRKITKEMLDKLASHIKEDGYHQRIIVDNDYTIIGGHQRKKALYMAGYDDETEIEVLKPSRKHNFQSPL